MKIRITRLLLCNVLAIGLTIGLTACQLGEEIKEEVAEEIAEKQADSKTNDISMPSDAGDGDIQILSNAQNGYIGEEKAKEIALADASLNAEEVVGLRVEREYDDDLDIVKYEVDFKKGNMEYEYEINAETGDIIKSETEFDD